MALAIFCYVIDIKLFKECQRMVVYKAVKLKGNL